MKLRLASIILLASVLIATPAMASTLYSNGPINGTVNAWNVCCQGFVVAESFTLGSNATITGFDAGLSVLSGDSPVSIFWFISANQPHYLGGSLVAFATGNLSNSLFCSGCGVVGAYDVYRSTVSGLNISLGPGTYYLDLLDGTTAFGPNSKIYWDQNSGPSTAYYFDLHQPTTVTRIPSESFNIYGTIGTPEPATLMLLGSGVAGLAGMLRRKIRL